MGFKIALCAVIGYLLGSLNTSIIVGKIYKIDVREHGSGNAGATNTLRVLGKLPALLVVLGDIFKGVIACIIGRYLGGESSPGVYAGEYLGGLFAVLGHNWPVYFGFKGGKGVATSFAVALMFSPAAAGICLLCFIVIVALTRYVSLGSIISGVAFPIAAILLKEPALLVGTGAVLGLLIVLRHVSNIRRLLAGQEKKLNFKQKESNQ